MNWFALLPFGRFFLWLFGFVLYCTSILVATRKMVGQRWGWVVWTVMHISVACSIFHLGLPKVRRTFVAAVTKSIQTYDVGNSPPSHHYVTGDLEFLHTCVHMVVMVGLSPTHQQDPPPFFCCSRLWSYRVTPNQIVREWRNTTRDSNLIGHHRLQPKEDSLKWYWCQSTS